MLKCNITLGLCDAIIIFKFKMENIKRKAKQLYQLVVKEPCPMVSFSFYLKNATFSPQKCDQTEPLT